MITPTTEPPTLTLVQVLDEPGTRAQHNRLPYRVEVAASGSPAFFVGEPLIKDGQLKSLFGRLILTWHPLQSTKYLPQSGWTIGWPSAGPPLQPPRSSRSRAGRSLEPLPLWRLYFLDGLGFVEIAQRLGVGVGTVFNVWHDWSFPRRTPGALSHTRAGLSDHAIATIMKERAKPEGERPTLEALGERFGVTRERIRQIAMGARRTTAKERRAHQ